MDHVREGAEPDAVRDGDGDLADHLAGVRRDDRGADNLILALPHVNLDEALLLAIGNRPVRLGDRHLVGVDRNPPFARVALVEPQVRHLGVGVGAPRHHQGRELLAPEEQRVLDHDLGCRIGRVRELPVHAHVTRGVDALVRGPQAVVDLHAAARIELDANRLEAEALDVWRPAGSHQDLVDDDLLLAVAPCDVKHLLVAFAFHLSDARAENQLDALADQRLLHDLRRIRVLANEDLRRPLEQAHARSQPLEALSQFATDRAGADHGEPLRSLGQLEDGLVGEVAGSGQALDGRRDGAGAGRDHGLLESQLRAIHVDGVASRKMGLTQVHVHAKLFAVAGRRILVTDARPDAAHALHGRPEVGEPLIGQTEA